MKMDRVKVCQWAPTQRASTGIKNVRCHDREMQERVSRYQWTLLLVVLRCAALEPGRVSVPARGSKFQDDMAQCCPFSMGTTIHNVQHCSHHMAHT